MRSEYSVLLAQQPAILVFVIVENVIFVIVEKKMFASAVYDPKNQIFSFLQLSIKMFT